MRPDLDQDMTELERLMWAVYDHVVEKGARIYEGGASVAEATYLQELAASSGARRIAEIGFNVGFSSIAFLHGSPDTHVVSFELDRRHAVEMAKLFVDERYPGRHELVVGNSLDTLPAYAETNVEPFDLVFVDGGHEYDVALADIRNAHRIAKTGALVVVDDVIPWYPWGVGPHQAWHEAIDRGLIEPLESFVDGRAVEEIVEPGDRAWVAGRFR